MANRITFDPSEDPTPEMMAAEQAALDQGEKLINAQEEDRARKFEQADAEQEDVSLIGGKFKSQDDLLKAYKELQKKLSSPLRVIVRKVKKRRLLRPQRRRLKKR